MDDVTPEEVMDEAIFNDAFKRLSENPNLLNKFSHWVKVAYGDVYAFVGERHDDDYLKVLVVIDEDCPVDNIKEMIEEGISDYSFDIGVGITEISRR